VSAQTVETWRLQENAWNPNRMDERMFGALVENMRRHGNAQPILVRPVDRGRFEVIDGAHRLRAARELGHEQVPVVALDVNEETAKALTLAMNRIGGTMAEIDVAGIVAELTEGTLPVEELAAFTGYTGDELEELVRLANFDWTPEPEPEQERKQPKDDDEWATLTFRVPATVADLVNAELDRCLYLLGYEGRADLMHMALEVMAVNSSQTIPEEVQ
jgi:ParB/RepB/Spo0J family partition protein